MIRVLVVHEVRLTCDLQVTALRKQADIEVVGRASTADEALTVLRRSACDVALVSISLSSLSFIQAATKLQRGLKVLVTGLTESRPLVLRCFEEGAAGYVHIDECLPALLKKIRSIHAGEAVISPAIATALMARISELRHFLVELKGVQTMNPSHLCEALTQRECEVLTLIEQGLNNGAIATTLCIELGTVKNHVHNIFDKFGVRTRKQAAMIARQALPHRKFAQANAKWPRLPAGGAPVSPEMNVDLALTYRSAVK
ncbi:MAG: response regulator transcription factor [Chloroflexota bacterium]|nr:response regulator transcription factor [Chloroflexota bacterium]